MKREQINWKNPIKNKHYVVVSELPEESQKQFEEWLIGKKKPVVYKEGDNFIDCAYFWDYTDFLNHLEIHK